MLSLISEALEKYAADHTAAESDLLRELARETREKTAVPEMMVGPVEGAFLRLLVRLTKAKRVLEIGTFTGYSALCMAEGLPEKGEIFTLDRDPEPVSIAQKYWTRSPHGRKIRPKLGPALETLKLIDGPLDLVFLDADKENYVKYWEECLPKVRKGGLLVADNVLWSGRVLEPREATDQAIAAFNEHVLKDVRVESALLTVRDGMTLACKL